MPRSAVRLVTALLGTALLGTGVLAGCTNEGASPSSPSSSSTQTTMPTPDTSASVQAELAKMTLEQKVGQMFVSVVYGTSATSPSASDAASNRKIWGSGVSSGADAVAKYHLGGVIYFGWSDNLDSAGQIAALSNGLQKAAVGDSGIPLQISVDEEGGQVNRIGAPLAASPGNMAIGATSNPTNAYQAALTTGTQLRALGINMDDAPVIDVNTNPANTADGTRAFGDQPASVSSFATEAIAGYQAAGVAAQAKHFPGLGDTSVNTDNAPALVRESRAQLTSIDMPPFQAAIKANVLSIMAAHITAPALDSSGTPASLSQPIVTGLLRNTLHYDGVVITDSLQAGALASIPADQVVLDAINAGDDELLMPNSPAHEISVVLAAVRAGKISQSRIDQSVTRILAMKQRLGLFTNPYATPSPVDSHVGTAAQQATMADIAQRSITLLRNDNHLLPLKLAAGSSVVVTGPYSDRLASDIAGRGYSVQRVPTQLSPSSQNASAAAAAAGGAALTIVTTSEAWQNSGQRNLVQAVLATGRPVLVVMLGSPYDLADVPGASTALVAYGSQSVSVDAAVKTMFGTAPTGKLPVTVPDADGHVIHPAGFGLGY